MVKATDTVETPAKTEATQSARSKAQTGVKRPAVKLPTTLTLNKSANGFEPRVRGEGNREAMANIRTLLEQASADENIGETFDIGLDDDGFGTLSDKQVQKVGRLLRLISGPDHMDLKSDDLKVRIVEYLDEGYVKFGVREIK